MENLLHRIINALKELWQNYFELSQKNTISQVRLTDVDIETYVHSSFGNGLDRRSIHGYCIPLQEQLVICKSKLQPMVTISSTEAEFRLMFMVKQVTPITKVQLKLHQRERELEELCT